jgi:hypothetical protein
MSRRRFPNQPIVFAATSPARPHCVRPQRRPRTPAVRLARRWHEWCGAQHSVRGSQRVSASAGLTVAVGAATNLCSKIVSPETMMAEQGGPTIGRVGRIVPEVILGAPRRAEADPSASSRISPIARGGDHMVFSSPHRGRPIMSSDHALERRVFDAYQEVKRARRDGDYAAICGWMSVVDHLLDRCAELRAKTRPSTSA